MLSAVSGMPLDAIKSTCFWMASGRWGKPCRHRDVIGRFELETEEQKSMFNKKTWRRIFVVCFSLVQECLLFNFNVKTA